MKLDLRSRNNPGRHSGRTRSGKMLLVTLTALICGSAVFGFAAYSSRAPRVLIGGPTRSPVRTATPSPPVVQDCASQVQAEIITIRPTGFEPAKIARPQGQFLLAVQNRSGLQTIDLVLADQAGRSVFAANVPIVRPDIARRFDLVPGSYVLREANHPDWSCTITIESK